MYLSWLKSGFTTRMLSWLFDIAKSTVSRYLVTWTNLLYFSISDKEIAERSGILNKHLWDDNDSIMADRGFTIQNELAPLNFKLNIPLFLGGRAQLTEAEVKESQTIASVRIHVERTITRIKQFKALNHILLTYHGSINQIWTVSCILSNFVQTLTQKNSAN